MKRPKLKGDELLSATEILVNATGKKMLNQDAYISPHEMFGFLTVAYNDLQRRLKDSNKIEVEELVELLSNVGLEVIASIASLYVAPETTEDEDIG